jgi:hypothetical protein
MHVELLAMEGQHSPAEPSMKDQWGDASYNWDQHRIIAYEIFCILRRWNQ